MIVYMLKNTRTQKCYIGATTATPTRRLSELFSKAKHGLNTKLSDSMRQYPKQTFEIHVLEKCQSRAQMFQAEAKWIEKLDTIKTGYNEAVGGIGNAGIFRKPECVRKSAASKVGKKRAPFSEDTKKKMSDAAKLRCDSEWRKKQSESAATSIKLRNRDKSGKLTGVIY